MRLPEGLDATQLAEAARDQGVLIEPGEVFFMSEPPETRCFRLGYSAIVPQQIEPGLRKLGELIGLFEQRAAKTRQG